MVQTRVWNGKNYRLSLKARTNKHIEAHNDFVRASQHVDYDPSKEHKRVSRLLKSITSSDQRVIAATTAILANNEKRNDFELAADFLLLIAQQKQSDGNEQQRVSVIYQGKRQDRGKRKGKSEVGETGVEFCYYKKMEFEQLTQ